MAYAAMARETIRLDEGDAIVLFPANLSPNSVGILRSQLEKMAAGLSARSSEDGRSYLRGLAELAAYVAH